MTEWVTQSKPMSCPVTCTYKTNMPAAINAFANTYLFVVTERHCVFLLPFYTVVLCGVTRYNFCCFFFEKLPNTVHFSSFIEFCNYMQYIHDMCRQPVNQIN